jgi:hypothetical protein
MKRCVIAFPIFLIAFFSTACTGGAIGPDSYITEPKIDVQISLAPLTEPEYGEVGTYGIEDPTAADFKKLTIDVKGEHLGTRTIRVPSVREITDVLTDSVVWFSHDARQDNLNEDHAAYHLETVLFVRNLTEQELRDRLSPLQVDVSYMDGGQKSVKRTYPLSQAVAVKESDGYNFTGEKEYTADGRSYQLEDTPENEAEALVAEDFLCSINGDFERMAQIEADTECLRISVQNEKEAFALGEATQFYAVHDLSSLPEGKSSEEDRDWVQSVQNECGLTSFRIVTAVYTVQWPDDVVPQYGNGTMTREILVGRSASDRADRIYDYGEPY